MVEPHGNGDTVDLTRKAPRESILSRRTGYSGSKRNDIIVPPTSMSKAEGSSAGHGTLNQLKT